MSDSTLKRRKATAKPVPDYPSADEVGKDRRYFIGLLGKGLLGVSVLGLVRCNAGAVAPILLGDTAADALDQDAWVPGGAQRPPDTLEDVIEEDFVLGGLQRPPDTIEDIVDEDFVLGGAPRPPDTITPPADVEGEFPSLPGEMVPPDVVTPEDIEDEFPPLDGDMPAPDVVTHED